MLGVKSCKSSSDHQIQVAGCPWETNMELDIVNVAHQIPILRKWTPKWQTYQWDATVSAVHE